MRRVGHRGADLLAPGNTLASFDAAVAAGVDMIEFDVLPEPGTGRLVLAHDYDELRSRAPLTLAQGLDHLLQARFAGLELDLDLKLPGREREVVGELRTRGLLDRTLISSHHLASLAALRRCAPGLRLGWSVPRVRRDYLRSPLTAVPARAAARLLRALMPARVAAALRAGRCDAVMAHWLLVTPALVRSIAAAGGELYVWTVDDARRIAELQALGVTGVITNDPRLFAMLQGDQGARDGRAGAWADPPGHSAG